MNRKDFIIAILVTFCLTATLFIVLPTKSSPNVVDYDPMADINGDGKIDMYDIGYTAQRFGTSGDPTKNMNVMNSYFEWGSLDIIIAPGESFQLFNASQGYSTVSFACAYAGPDFPPMRLDVYFSPAGVDGPGLAVDSFEMNSSITTYRILMVQRTYAVVGGEFSLQILDLGNEPAKVGLYVYMTT
jgi:hypothetical protein